jgi:Protein of unknown function (DUF3089)
VAAYVVGYDVPMDIERAGLPVCRAAGETGCLIDWNTVKEGATDRRAGHRLIWLDGRYQPSAGHTLICVNPLNWLLAGQAPAALNLGALPAARSGEELRATKPGLTGAACDGPLLRVALPAGQHDGFSDLLTVFGSYHVFDYILFYGNILANARQRLDAWQALPRRASG